MKNQRSFTKNKVDNSTESSLNGQKFDSVTRSRFKLVLHRLFFKKKDVLGLYSYKPRVFLRTLLSRRCSNVKTELKVNSNSVLNNYNKDSSNYIKNYINNSRNIRMAGIAASFALVLMGAATMAPLYNKTNSAEATVGNEVPADTELEITTSSNVAGVDLLVTDGNGTSASSDKSGNTLGFNVTTNNYTGYTLTISGKDDTGKLTNTDTTNCTDATKCALNTISSASDTISVNGTWGYKPSKLNSATNTSYLPSPTTTATTLDETDGPNSTVKGYTIDLAAKANYTQPAGVYSNTYVLQAVGNKIEYKISFNSYTSDVTDTVPNLPTALADSVSATSIKLTNDKTPTRTGYTFSKWCLGTTSGSGTVCNGTAYAVGDDFGIDQTVDNSDIKLYAVWTRNTYSLTINFAGNGVYRVAVKSGSASGTTMGTVSASGGSVSNLAYGAAYYLVPEFADSKYGLDSWSKTSGYGTLSCVATGTCSTDTTPTFTMGAGNGTVTITGKQNAVPLYDTIAAMSKGTQTLTELRAAIVAPTSSATISSNSGVYEYNSSVFGAASDAASTHKIYYYRGILDSYGKTGSYGSDGLADAYPNYVILDADGNKTTSDTCWRIVRTTGSGGVKMIYNGKWTGSTCANSQSNAQVTTSAFDTTANSSGKSIVGVGYTYNASYKSTTAATAYSTLFGSNTSYSGNSTNSTIKGNIETWFNNNIDSYSSKLEPSAGYCNDRTLNTGTSWTSPMSDSTTVSTPYSSASSGNTAYYFGAYIRNASTAKAPSLTCTRNNADLYTTSSASNGNKQLGKPVALLTADEVSFAGSGSSTATNGSSYHANSYLRSGSSFWLLSPNSRNSNGHAYEFYLYSNGYLNYGTDVRSTYGVRPAISLTSGTTPTSGSGTATDPWVVQ